MFSYVLLFHFRVLATVVINFSIQAANPSSAMISSLRPTPRVYCLWQGSRRFYSSKQQNKKKNSADKSTISENAALSNMLISNKQQLYTLSPYLPGSVFFLPNGTKLFNKLIQFIRAQETKKLGFREVVTPLMYKKELFDISNHWQYYNEDMFKIHRKSHTEGEQDETYALKPMNCPGHCLLYKQMPKNINDLPVRYSDFSSLHRNEASGALSGLTRVRRFHQDDGHIFCTFKHLETEILANLKLVEMVYAKFGLPDFKILLSTRPKDNQFIGKEEDWERAESTLTELLNKIGKKWELNEGDGAFYGPKIDVILEDKFGKFHQVATIQLDFQLPNNFELKFQNEQGQQETPIIIHRAIFGSVERFLAMLMDHFEGKWPFWLNANQVKIVPVSPEKHQWVCDYIESYIVNNGAPDYSFEEYQNRQQSVMTADSFKNHEASGKFKELAPITAYDFNVEVDSRAEPLGKRIKDAYSRSFNYLMTVGDQECESALATVKNGKNPDEMTVTLKALYGEDKNKVEKVSLKEALEKFILLERNYK